jgi:hypothetical protein
MLDLGSTQFPGLVECVNGPCVASADYDALAARVAELEAQAKELEWERDAALMAMYSWGFAIRPLLTPALHIASPAQAWRVWLTPDADHEGIPAKIREAAGITPAPSSPPP